jgi:hypothetical protein
LNQAVSLLQFSGSLLDAIFQLYLGLADSSAPQKRPMVRRFSFPNAMKANETN